MAYTIDEAIIEVRSLINEPLPAFWTDAEIEGWVKECAIDVSTKLLSVEDEDTITMATDQWIYTSSDEAWLADNLKIKGCYYDAGSGDVKGLQRIDIQKFGHTQVSSGNPRNFFENNRKFYVWPIPTATEDGNDINVFHAYETDDIANLRDEHQPLTFLYAAAKAKAKDRMFQESALYMSQYLNAINFERQDKYDFGVDPFSTFKLK